MTIVKEFQSYFVAYFDTMPDYFGEACSSWDDLQMSFKVIRHCTW